VMQSGRAYRIRAAFRYFGMAPSREALVERGRAPLASRPPSTHGFASASRIGWKRFFTKAPGHK
jgi:hypothetical protein